MEPCPSCGHESRAGQKFCAQCGAGLAAACPACGVRNEPGEKFCGQCGQALGVPPPSRTPTPQPSHALPASFAAGRYHVQRFLGEGGRKRVYLAHDTKLDRDVAIAVIKTEGLDASGLARVRREAQAMGRLGDHPHIVTVYDIGDEAGQPYIVSQHMAGGDLETRLRQAEDRRLPLDEALRIANEVRQALEHAHARGIIHRDLKPGNIWLTEAGTAKLGDFGLAVALDQSRLTSEGMMVGTATYMPPEQALGRQPDARSDLYALGSVMYEMVTGRPPFLGDDSVAIISQHINTAPVAPTWHNPAVPRALENLILALMAKSPQERPASAAAVGEELARIKNVSVEQDAAELAPTVTAVHQAGAWGRFVGRRQEMDALKAALDDILSGRGRLMMIVGEPGIGKSRLAQEFTVYAGLRGAKVLSGRCYEGDVAVPYMPFVEAFREYVRTHDDPDLRRELGEGAPEVAKLVSEIRQRFPDIPEAPPLEGDAERLRLFESVNSFVCKTSAGSPLVLFLDDIHWADKPSLLLLQYLARGTGSHRVLLVSAYRDVELDRAHPLSEVVAGLRRERLYERVLLRGLPREDVRALVTAIGQQSASADQGEVTEEFANAIYGETEGNPFFVEEVLKHLVEEGKLYREEGRWAAVSEITRDIPEGIREAIGRRLSHLSDDCNRMLTLASTMTGGFSWELLLAVSGDEEERLLDLLDEALRALVIRERRNGGAGTYEFTHALIRQTLYGELNTPRRVRLHRQIGEAMERTYGANVEPHLVELAHHFFQAAPGGDVDKAIDYAVRAAERALSLTAYEESAGLYDIALQALELGDRPDEGKRCELLLAMGEAQNGAGARDRAKETFLGATDWARKRGDGESQARAALGFAGVFGQWGVVDERTRGLLEDAFDAMDEGDSALGVLLLSRLGMELYFSGFPEPAEEPSRRSVEMARRVGDSRALADALWTRYLVLGGPDHVEERLAAGAEIVRLAKESGAREERGIYGHYFRIVAQLELGNLQAGYDEIEAYIRLAEELRQPHYLGWATMYKATRALIEGRHHDARRLNQEASYWVERAQEPLLAQLHLWQMMELHRQKGQLEDIEAELRREMGETPMGWFQWQLVCLQSETGREAEARAWFDRCAARDFADVPRDGQYLTHLCLASRACVSVDDGRRAAVLYDMLLPYAERNAVGQGFTDYLGSISHYLGLLAATMQRWEDAQRHFEDALRMNDRMGANALIAWNRHDYADMLLCRDDPGDMEKALELVTQTLDAAQGMGMEGLVKKALSLKLRIQGIDASDVQSSIDVVAAAVQSEHPDLRRHAAPDGTVTILFSDIEGSTAMTERLGDQRWLEVLRSHNAIVRKRLAAHDGFEVKSEGDGFMLAFQSARRALECAVDIQRAFAARNESAEEPIKVRIGLHTGEALKEGEDFFGKNVILAARIASQAQGGQILVSSLLKELTESAAGVAFGEGREVALKGLTGAHRVYEVVW